MTRGSGMDSLVPLVQKIVVSRMTEGGSSPHFVTTSTICMAASVMLVSTGLIFGLYAEYIWLQTFFVPEAAALVVSGSACVLALMFSIIGKVAGQKNRVSEGYPADITKIMKQIIESLSEELEDSVRENPKTALMLAGLSGFAAGERHI